MAKNNNRLPLTLAYAREHWQDGEIKAIGCYSRITPKAARFLSRYAHRLCLWGLDELSPYSANLLANSEAHTLYLDGLTHVSKELMQTIACFRGERLSLSGLSRLSEDTACVIAQTRAKELYLDGLKELSIDEASALAQFKGNLLSLKGIECMTSDVASILQKRQAKVLVLRNLAEFQDSVTTNEFACLGQLDHDEEVHRGYASRGDKVRQS
jgi:hypothetical protein